MAFLASPGDGRREGPVVIVGDRVPVIIACGSLRHFIAQKFTKQAVILFQPSGSSYTRVTKS